MTQFMNRTVTPLVFFCFCLKALNRSVPSFVFIMYADIALIGKTVFWEYLENLEDCMPGGDRFIREIKSLALFDVARGRLFIRCVVCLFACVLVCLFIEVTN